MKLSRTTKISTHHVLKSGKRYLLKEVELKSVVNSEFLQSLKTINQELCALKEFQWAAPVVVAVLDAWILNDFSKVFVVHDFLPVSLREALDQRKAPVPIDVAESWCAQVAAGLAGLHTKHFCHFALTSKRVLLSEDWKAAKISDIHLLRTVVADDDIASVCPSSTVSTTVSSFMASSQLFEESHIEDDLDIAYWSPEICNGGDRSTAGDMWSFGVVIAEIVTGEIASELSRSQGGESPELPAIRSMQRTEAKPLVELTGELCQQDPRRRPTSRDLVRLPLFDVYYRSLAVDAPEFWMKMSDGVR